MSPSFIEQKNPARIDLHSLLLDDQNEILENTQKLIEKDGRYSAIRRRNIYQQIFKDSMPAGSGPSKASRRTSASINLLTVNPGKKDSAIGTVIHSFREWN